MDSNLITIKVVLLGEIDTGKTNIIYRIMSDTFYEIYESTSIPSEQSKQYMYEGKQYVINFWDTVGQEKYRALTPRYYKSAQVIILVYSIVDKKSFDEIRNFWIKEIISNVNDKYSIKFIYIIIL